MKDAFVQGCVALVFLLAFGLVLHGPRDKVPQRVADQTAARKHRDADACRVPPCTDLPHACFLHGGAPTAPECLRD